jgi:hypothetical protein
MPAFLKRALPDWLLIIVASKLAATSILLSMGFG